MQDFFSFGTPLLVTPFPDLCSIVYLSPLFYIIGRYLNSLQVQILIKIELFCGPKLYFIFSRTLYYFLSQLLRRSIFIIYLLSMYINYVNYLFNFVYFCLFYLCQFLLFGYGYPNNLTPFRLKIH